MQPDPSNFIEIEVDKDLEAGRFSRPVCTRFPPEPNGYWHLGHVYALTINSGIAEKYRGLFNLRFDDTNPASERQEFVDAALDDLKWLGIPITGKVVYASDFFSELYEIVERLVRNGHAYVCDLSPDELKEWRGDYHAPGRPSPYRDRSVAENLDLLNRMRDREFAPGKKSVRAKIDMTSPNMNLRDPILYRIMSEPHYRQGAKWHIYPSYDFAQSFNDALDGVTHSLCSSEFISHRPLYDWLLEKAEFKEPPRQIEFGKLGIEGAVLGKRHIRRMVEGGVLSGWDDPRLFTVKGMRRRGFPAETISDFCRQVGVSKADRTIDVAALEQFVRQRLNASACRRMAVLKPVKLVLENLADGESVIAKAENNPEDAAAGTREIALTRELFIEADDFMIDPPKKFFRLAPGKEVRLRAAFVIKCTGCKTDPATGRVAEIRATYDPETLGRNPPDGRKVRGVIHWVSARDAIDLEVRLYDRLVGESADIDPNSNSSSTVIAKAEPSVAQMQVGDRMQFERIGYFAVDPDSRPGAMVLNRIVTLKDSWSAIQAREAGSSGDRTAS
jgi:glutaminyl-tRNA synthetase